MLERPFRFFYFIALDLHKQSDFLFKNAFNAVFLALAKMLLRDILYSPAVLVMGHVFGKQPLFDADNTKQSTTVGPFSLLV